MVSGRLRRSPRPPTQFVSEIVTGKKEITRESAAQIGAALGQSAEYWLKLQDQYLLARAGARTRPRAKLDEVRRRAILSGKAPIPLLQKRNVLLGITLDELEARSHGPVRVSRWTAEPGFAAAANVRTKGEDISILQRAWVACVRKEAHAASSGEEVLARSGLRETRPHRYPGPSEDSDDFAGLARVVRRSRCAAGLCRDASRRKDRRLRHVRQQCTRVIGLSGRGKRLDKVLFTLLHEIAHILNRPRRPPTG